MQGCVISCGTVVYFQKSCNLSRSLLTNNNFYCAKEALHFEWNQDIFYFSHLKCFEYILVESTALLDEQVFFIEETSSDADNQFFYIDFASAKSRNLLSLCNQRLITYFKSFSSPSVQLQIEQEILVFILLHLVRYTRNDRYKLGSLTFNIIELLSIPDHLEKATFVRTKFGNAMLVDTAGFVYNCNNKTKNKIFWKCRDYFKHKCTAKATTEGLYIAFKSGSHIHSPPEKDINGLPNIPRLA